MLPFTKILAVAAVLSCAYGQRPRSSRAYQLDTQRAPLSDPTTDQTRERRSSYYNDDEYGYGMPKSIVLKDNPHIDNLFPYPRFPRVYLPLEPSHYQYSSYKRNDVETSVRGARSYSGFGMADFQRRSGAQDTLQKRTMQQRTRTGRAAPVPTAALAGKGISQSTAPAANTARTSLVSARQIAPVEAPRQRRSSVPSEVGPSQSAIVPVYEPYQNKNKRADFYAVPDAEYDVVPGYEAYQKPSYRSSPAYPTSYKSYEEPSYGDKKPAYKKTSYSEPSYKKTYDEPAYKPAYSEPAYKEPAYKQSYKAPAYKPAYQEPAYQAPSYKPTYPEPAYKPKYSEPAYPEPAYQPEYKKPAYKPSYEQTYKPSYEPTYKPSYEPTYKPSYEPTYNEDYKPKLPSYEPASGDEVAYGAQSGSYGAFNWYTDHPVQTPAKPSYY